MSNRKLWSQGGLVAWHCLSAYKEQQPCLNHRLTLKNQFTLGHNVTLHTENDDMHIVTMH